MKILLAGGSKSGKSLLAQRLTKKLANGGPLYYWATMEPTDGEDLERIQRHRQERKGWGYETIECGRNLGTVSLGSGATVLFDSVTALLAGEMFAPDFDEEAEKRCLEELLMLGNRVWHMIYVADNLFLDSGKYEWTTERYREALGRILCALAQNCDTVAEVTAGIPMVYKGELP